MERAEWLAYMRRQAEALYDHLSPEYWARFDIKPEEYPAHRQYLQQFLGSLERPSTLLSAGCGAGRWEGVLLEAGHRVVGIDQSAGMLRQAREHHPTVRYEQMGLQEMNFHEAFDGAVCIDALEHVCPEDWPGIMRGFGRALKPGGRLYFTSDVPEAERLKAAYERAQAQGLPVVYGEVADRVDELFERLRTGGISALTPDEQDLTVYHYDPPLEQVRAWLEQAGLTVEAEGFGDDYAHFVAAAEKQG